MVQTCKILSKYFLGFHLIRQTQAHLVTRVPLNMERLSCLTVCWEDTRVCKDSIPGMDPGFPRGRQP